VRVTHHEAIIQRIINPTSLAKVPNRKAEKGHSAAHYYKTIPDNEARRGVLIDGWAIQLIRENSMNSGQ
jgi:hypothetical protein